AVSRAGEVGVFVRCAGPTVCTGTASLSLARTTASPGAPTRLIATRRFHVSPGVVAPVRLRLTHAGRALLDRRGGHLTARLTIADQRPGMSRGVSARLRSAHP
ncbi:MAG: hypothetical protein QOE27_2698, partial [Solirubrobacteraceae bacterium]|nr:hypothetical protein [Solirubrobacteraceae bacterium]